ncbi:hybrid sensor histidine kinase/response regulator [Parabacteroides johnsonii]|uniref:hybrid sensor histidine kinase/response regulator n=1 Tax=Parabacteroides johnsonii TaxID=387661 RepID=UPI00189A1152|nr:hybrid sensor histidine kinase/response regulator [Parabacteroides johnsonii]
MKITAYYTLLITGYVLLFVIMTCFTGIILNERSKKQQIEDTVTEIRSLRRLVDTAHRQIAELSLIGESVAGWEEADCYQYKEKTIILDSTLLAAKLLCKGFISCEQIDSLRSLFSQKEMFMSRLMRLSQTQDWSGKPIIQQLPELSKEAMVTEQQNRKESKGFRLFKKKEKNLGNSSLDRLHALNKSLVRQQQDWERQFGRSIDSLQGQNIQLNQKMNILIAELDSKTQEAIQKKETDIQSLYSFSSVLIVCGIISSILLLAFLFYATYRDRKQHLKVNGILEDTLKQNRLLVDSQKKILLAVSHDVRGPLGTILNSAELVMDIREKKKRNIHLGNIQVTCRHILRIVNDLMDVYRIEAGKDSVNTVPFRLRPMLGKIVEVYRKRANTVGLQFKSKCEVPDIIVNGDSDRIERVLENLLSNAVKFTPNGSVCLSASYENGALSLTIQDTGIGMSEETLSEVFEPLVRAAPDVDAGGFGLGLPIVRGLVRNMSGTLDVKSEVGRGTVFHVSLPLSETDSDICPEMRPTEKPSVLPKRIIAIDDDRMQLAVLKEMLERNGIACRAYNHVKEVVIALREGEYDLILTDIQMAGAGGFELLSLLRTANIGNSKSIPVAAMTARGDDKLEVYLKAGFCDCIFKPFSMNELLSFLTAQMPRNKTDADVDFSVLTDEVDDKTEILKLFIAESSRDIKELEDGLKCNNRTSMRNIVHRMLPTWTLLQRENILYAYQNFLHDEQVEMRILEEETERIILWIQEFISGAGEELKRMKYEEKDTDC